MCIAAAVPIAAVLLVKSCAMHCNCFDWPVQKLEAAVIMLFALTRLLHVVVPVAGVGGGWMVLSGIADGFVKSWVGGFHASVNVSLHVPDMCKLCAKSHL